MYYFWSYAYIYHVAKHDVKHRGIEVPCNAEPGVEVQYNHMSGYWIFLYGESAGWPCDSRTQFATTFFLQQNLIYTHHQLPSNLVGILPILMPLLLLIPSLLEMDSQRMITSQDTTFFAQAAIPEDASHRKRMFSQQKEACHLGQFKVCFMGGNR